MPRPSSPHLRGVVIVVAGTLCLVPDATLVRLAEAGDLLIVFWRSLFIALSLVAFLAIRRRSGTVRAYRAIGVPGLAVGLLWGLALVGFVYSINHTAVANTLVILATAPFFAAIFTRLLIGERVHPQTWLAMAAAAAGVTLTFGAALRLGGMAGNLAALGVAVALGLNLTVIRRAEGVDMLPAISISGLVAAAVTSPFAWPLAITARDALVIGAMGLVLVPLALALITVGARYLPSPEITLLMTIETILGPLLAWAVIGEQPPPFAAVGGAIVVATLVGHSVAAQRRGEPRPLDPLLPST